MPAKKRSKRGKKTPQKKDQTKQEALTLATTAMDLITGKAQREVFFDPAICLDLDKADPDWLMQNLYLLILTSTIYTCAPLIAPFPLLTTPTPPPLDTTNAFFPGTSRSVSPKTTAKSCW